MLHTIRLYVCTTRPNSVHVRNGKYTFRVKEKRTYKFLCVSQKKDLEISMQLSAVSE